MKAFDAFMVRLIRSLIWLHSMTGFHFVLCAKDRALFFMLDVKDAREFNGGQ